MWNFRAPRNFFPYSYVKPEVNIMTNMMKS